MTVTYALMKKESEKLEFKNLKQLLAMWEKKRDITVTSAMDAFTGQNAWKAKIGKTIRKKIQEFNSVTQIWRAKKIRI